MTMRPGGSCSRRHVVDATIGPEPFPDQEVTHVTMQVPERLLTPGEVALMFRVDPKTVTRWASSGRVGSIRTPGGHRRFREAEINRLLADRIPEGPRATA